MDVAVLGLGRMGQAIVRRLIEGGHTVEIWNRSKGRAAALVEQGAQEASSLDEAVEGAEVVITSLSNDDAVREVALGDSGIGASIGDRTYVDASTISPSLSGELARSFTRFVALPILGAPQAVSGGEAIYLVGGDQGIVDGLGPVLDSLGGRLKRFARPELASAAKLVVNLLLLSGIATLVEAVAIGRASGLSDNELTDLLCDSPMLAPGLENRLQAIFEGSGPAWWTTVLAAKDARLAAAVGESGGARLRIAATLSDLYQEAADAGHEDEDMTAVSTLY